MRDFTFQLLMMDFHNQVSDEQVLAAIGDQVRLNYVRGALNSPGRLLGTSRWSPHTTFTGPIATKNEKVSAKLVEVPVDKFLAKVPDPSEAEIRAFYDFHKDSLPDPTRATPGFKVPRQVQVEILSVDGNALARSSPQGRPDRRGAAGRLREPQGRVRGQGRPQRPADRPVRRPPRADPAGHPAVQRGPLDPGNSLAEEKSAVRRSSSGSAKIKRDVLDKYFDDYQGGGAEQSGGGQAAVRLGDGVLAGAPGT